MAKELTIKARVESNEPLTEAEIERIRSALRGSRIKELGFGLGPASSPTGPNPEMLHDMIDMHHEHETKNVA